MKKMLIAFILVASTAFFTGVDAQVRINVNIGSQPDWGPVGYDRVSYYYLPDIDAYYYVPDHQFIYRSRNRWIYANALPPSYGRFNLYNGYKVVVNEPKPYLHNDVYREKYGRYKGGKGPRQEMIRDSHDERYKNHWRDDNGHRDNGNGKNNGRGHGNQNNHGRDKHDKH